MANLLAACRRRGIPTLLANARLSARSARRYRRLGRLAREALAGIDRVAAQAAPDAARFAALGVAEARLRVTGSIKFDIRLPASALEQVAVMGRFLGAGRPLWVAASTHEGEEEQVLEAHRQVLVRHPAALLVLVPRHPERFDRVAALVERRGLVLARRSLGAPCRPGTQVYLADTMGELPILLGAADLAFFGGSLVPVGGHNLLEAAAQGVPVVFGPHMRNFATIGGLLLEEGAAAQVADATALGAQVTAWLGDPAGRSRVGERGRRVVAENQGALERLCAEVEALLEADGTG